MPALVNARARALLLVGTWLALALLLAACRGVEPPPSVPPVVPASLANATLSLNPAAALLQRDDLPAGFQLAGGESDAGEALALYLRPAALDPAAAGGNTLLSVLVNISAYTTTVQAADEFARLASDPTGQAVSDIARIGEAASQIELEPAAGGVVGAAAAESYRVAYRLLDRRVFDYAHRFQMGNLVVAVVVSALGNPGEPATLHAAAQQIVQRQIDRIAEQAAGP